MAAHSSKLHLNLKLCPKTYSGTCMGREYKFFLNQAHHTDMVIPASKIKPAIHGTTSHRPVAFMRIACLSAFSAMHRKACAATYDVFAKNYSLNPPGTKDKKILTASCVHFQIGMDRDQFDRCARFASKTCAACIYQAG